MATYPQKFYHKNYSLRENWQTTKMLGYTVVILHKRLPKLLESLYIAQLSYACMATLPYQAS